ncbi:MAG TPA: GIY-YIG nuclease family protein [Burkholderiales bacterium]|nr:GIY-YIG nuclease family protein [Burkholderiales bacterium]
MIRIKAATGTGRIQEVGAYISYQLLLRLKRCAHLRIGRLGAFDFPAGRYLYTGSARHNLEARIARHIRAAKRLHWHIDYLLCCAGVEVLRVRRFRTEECAVNSRTRGTIPVPGFGASDCRAGCGAHLKYLGSHKEEK